jgi:predicted small secreted protein
MTISSRASTLPRVPSLQHRRAAFFGLAILMVAGLMLSGCNTVAGAGQDVRATGNAVTRGADDVKTGL